MFVFSAVIALQTATSVAITGGTVIDGTGAAPRPNTTIIVQGERIAAIGPAADVAVPAGALRIDATGKFVLPGFIDLHVHLMYPPTDAPQSDGIGVLRALRFMNLFQAAGVTALRDVGGTVPVMQSLLEGSARGYIESSRLFPVGQLITRTGGHGTTWSYFASGPEGFREAVRRMYDAGFRHIKLSPQYTLEEVKAAVDEAKIRGMEVTSHGGGYSDAWPPTMTRRAVQAGVDCVEHLNDMPDDVLDSIAAKGIHVVPTLAIYKLLYSLRPMPGTLQELMAQRGWNMELHEKIFRKAVAKGVQMGIGTDAVGTILDTSYPQLYFDEMEYFVTLGVSRLNAIKAASLNGAIILHREKDLGSLEKGKYADLQVVDGDPLTSFASLGAPGLVRIGGKVRVRRDAATSTR
jgi:imidazolonepropionase-like amidohydrolase